MKSELFQVFFNSLLTLHSSLSRSPAMTGHFVVGETEEKGLISILLNEDQHTPGFDEEVWFIIN